MADPETTETTIRWVWGCDTSGRRVTVAEAIGFRIGPDGVGHPAAETELAPLPGFTAADAIHLITSEFPPEDLDV